MPSDVIRVRQVVSMPTERHGVTRHLINAETADGRWTKQYQTINDWLGSLCQRALDQDVPVEVVWKDSKYGQQLVSVEPQA